MYASILVHCNDPRRIETLLTPAVALAEKSEAHVLALSVVPPVAIIGGSAEMAPMVEDGHCVDYRAHNGEMRAAFDERVAGRALVAEWRDAEAGAYPVTNVALPISRTFDLIMASQTDPSWANSERLDIAETLVLESGRPVLVVPNMPAKPTIGQRILVAWDGHRESARAVFDAMPLLKAAGAVKVVSVKREGEADASVIDVAEICRALDRNHVKCEGADHVAQAENIGAALLDAAKAYDADLLVMGCYGHSRLREFVFGGVSRYVLAHMHLPVLMSH